MGKVFGCERDRTNLAIVNFSATFDRLGKKRERRPAELLDDVLGFHSGDQR